MTRLKKRVQKETRRKGAADKSSEGCGVVNEVDESKPSDGEDEREKRRGEASTSEEERKVKCLREKRKCRVHGVKRQRGQ